MSINCRLILLPCSVRTEAISQLVSSLQRSTLQRSALVEESTKLLERCHNFQTNALGGCVEQDSLPGRALSKSTQSRVEDQPVDSLLKESIHSPVEQRLHSAQVRNTLHIWLIKFCTKYEVNTQSKATLIVASLAHVFILFLKWEC